MDAERDVAFTKIDEIATSTQPFLIEIAELLDVDNPFWLRIHNKKALNVPSANIHYAPDNMYSGMTW